MGGYAQMITILHRGGGPLGTPKSDYVICARPLPNGYHGCWNLIVTLVRITRSKQQQRDTWVNGGIINTARYKTGSNELIDRLFNGKGSDSRR